MGTITQAATHGQENWAFASRGDRGRTVQTQGGLGSAQQSQHTPSFPQAGRILFLRVRTASLQGKTTLNSNPRVT